MEVNDLEYRCRCLASQLESERQCVGCQCWRQPRQPLEGEAEWWVGVCQDD